MRRSANRPRRTPGIETYDIALQYDGVADAPSWVLNPLALANALAGFQYVHGTYLDPRGDDPATATPYGYTPEQVQAAIENAKENCSTETHCQKVDGSDTYYITLPAKTLPIMQPFLDLGAATGTSALVVPLVDLVSPMAQTLIETGYTRTDYSTPTPFRLLPRFNPVTAGDRPRQRHPRRHPGSAQPRPRSTAGVDRSDRVRRHRHSPGHPRRRRPHHHEDRRADRTPTGVATESGRRGRDGGHHTRHRGGHSCPAGASVVAESPGHQGTSGP